LSKNNENMNRSKGSSERSSEIALLCLEDTKSYFQIKEYFKFVEKNINIDYIKEVNYEDTFL